MTKIDVPGQSPADLPADADSGTGCLRAELARKHASAVLAVCLANTEQPHDAEDLMQETFVKAFARLNGLRDPDKARAWLVQIARRLCIDHVRRRKPASSIPDDLPARTESHDPRIERLHAALARLPDGYRETISLYYLDGRSSANVSATLGVPPSTVRMRLLRARVMLCDLLKENDK